VVYFVAVTALGGVEEKELLGFPKGYLLVSLAKRCYLLRESDDTENRVKKRKKRNSVEKNKEELL